MRTFAVLAAVLAAVLVIPAALLGCAAPEPQPANVTTVAAAPQRPLTGSRLTRSGTDRSLRFIGRQEVEDEHPITSLGNEVGPRSN